MYATTSRAPNKNSMDKLREIIKTRIDQASRKVEELQRELRAMPPGCLAADKRGSHWAYRIRGYDPNDRTQTKYVSVKDARTLKMHARKKYVPRLIKALNDEIDSLSEACRGLDHDARYRAYEDLPDGIRRLFTPDFIRPEHLCEEWSLQDHPQHTGHHENLIFETSRGDMVRSKTEVIIADMLYSNDIAYRYEQEVSLGPGYICHPDFTIMRKSDAKIFYWEHFGRLTDPQYAEEFVTKLNMYARAGITTADDLLITWECYEVPFDRAAAARYIRMLKE